MGDIIEMRRADPAPWPRRGVYKVDQYTWFVPSRHDEGVWRRVEYHHDGQGGWMTCDCPKGRNLERGQAESRDPHVLLVALAEKEDGLPPRPAGRIDGSVFVD